MNAAETLWQIFRDGGWAMWPLLVLSVLALTVTFERCVFWLRTHRAASRRRYARLLRLLAKNDRGEAAALAARDRTVYARFADALLRRPAGEGGPSEAEVITAAEDLRPAVERFSTLLSTIITAAPMLGILGTVTGIIDSFGILSSADAVRDPTLVAGGIAEALYTTAFGLLVALLALFPYVVFRTQADRCLTRLETLGSAILAR